MQPISTAPRTGRRVRTTGSPLVWAPAAIAGVGLVAGVTATGPGPVPVIGAAAAVYVYWAVMHWIGRRATPEIQISRRGAGREALLGASIGLGFMLVSVLSIAGLGAYSFSWAHQNAASVVASAVATAAGAAVTEELMFRGAALQGLEQRWGSRVALAITAVFFGAAHLTVAGASVWSGAAIALEAGGLLGAAFLWRRNIWFVAGLHFAWNAVEQLLGVPVSGHAGGPSLLTVKTSGSHLLTGGVVGLEASVVPVTISVLIAVPMLVAASRRGTLRTARRPERAA